MFKLQLNSTLFCTISMHIHPLTSKVMLLQVRQVFLIHNCTWKTTQSIEAQGSIFNKNGPSHNPGSFFTFLNTNIIYFPLIFRYIYLTALNLETSIKISKITKLLFVRCAIRPVQCESAFFDLWIMLKVVFHKIK